MANVLLGATGSVAAVRVPALHDALTADGHAVKVVATTAATYFFDPADVGPGRTRSTSDGVGEPQAPARGSTRGNPVARAPGSPGSGRNPDVVILDEDEWPGRGAGERYARGDRVLHIELRKWADVYLVAPLDAPAGPPASAAWRTWPRSSPPCATCSPGPPPRSRPPRRERAVTSPARAAVVASPRSRRGPPVGRPGHIPEGVAMRTLLGLLLGGFVFGLSGPAAVADDKDKDDFAKKIVGKWEITKAGGDVGAGST